MPSGFKKDIQFYRFSLYGFFKNLRFFEAFLILFFLEKGLSFFAIGSLYAIREITINIFEIPSGIIADSFGRRRSMLLAFVFYIISFIVFFYADDYLSILPAMIIFSLGEAFRSGNHKAMIYHYLMVKGWEDQKVRYYGYTRSWSQIGSALSALSGAAIVFMSGSYRYIFLFSVIPYILDFILVASYPRFLDGNMQRPDWAKMKQNFSEVFSTLIQGLKTKKVISILGNLSIYSGYYKAVKDYLQPMIAVWALSVPLLINYDNEQRSAFMVGGVFFVVYLLSSIASRASGSFAGKFKYPSAPLNITLLIGLLCGMFTALFYIGELWLLSVVLFILIYMIENIRKPIGVAYLGESIEKSALASILSVDSQLKSLSAAVLALLFGTFADLYGIGWGLLIVSACLLLLSPILVLMKETK